MFDAIWSETERRREEQTENDHFRFVLGFSIIGDRAEKDDNDDNDDDEEEEEE